MGTLHLNVRNFPVLGFSHQFFALTWQSALVLQPTRFPHFLNPRASKRPHGLHWQAIFRLGHQKSAKEQPHRRRRSWEASARSAPAKPLLPPGLGVTPSSPWRCPVGCSPPAVLALQAGIPNSSPLQPPRTSPRHTEAPRASLPTPWALPKWSQCRKRGTQPALAAHSICYPKRWAAMTSSMHGNGVSLDTFALWGTDRLPSCSICWTPKRAARLKREEG